MFVESPAGWCWRGFLVESEKTVGHWSATDTHKADMVALKPLGLLDHQLIHDIFNDYSFQEYYVLPAWYKGAPSDFVDYWIGASIHGVGETHTISFNEVKGGFVEWYYINPNDKDNIGLSFALLPQFRDKKIMFVALSIICEMLKNKNTKYIFCEVSSTDKKAQRLLRGLDFKFHDLSPNPGPKSLRGVKDGNVGLLKKDLYESDFEL